ncbi:metal-dependent hydrolase [Aedoeadaptatus ivorii]|uniref:Metal-dependent hydrolase n=1 Tax=Aedoeadaptatus ivorii TaxID=54006 RepID=A0A3S4Z453_9FIRM|nr:MBL fold metallo-hydrolase [Peptoniphilus ivorii]VEJ35944.1 metal-dependent hydrolase [Peptoniphilus ivorii]
MKITNFGTTTLLFDDGEDQVLFDANFTRPTVGRYLFRKVDTDCDLIDDLFETHGIDRLRAVFISHSHYDHVIDAPYIARRCGATLYGSESTKNVGLGGGVPTEQLAVFEGYKRYRIGHFEITVIPSLHSRPVAFHDDIGEEIEAPLARPSRLRKYKEGGSYDFYVQNGEKRYLIHPSGNYIEGRLEGYPADVLFLAVAGYRRLRRKKRRAFFDETIGRTAAKLVVPIHWDNFFVSLNRPVKRLPRIAERTDRVAFHLVRYCEEHGVNTVVQLPHTSMEV